MESGPLQKIHNSRRKGAIVKRFVKFLVPMLIASGAAAQTCPLVMVPEEGSLSKTLNPGIAVAAPPGAEEIQQEKAPPDSVFVDVQPTLKKKANPVYPKAALAAGIEGAVYIRLLVDKEGKVQDVKIVRSENDALNQSAIDAARQYEFAPATAAGKPVAVWVTVPFKFKIAEKSGGAPAVGLPAGMKGVIDCIMTLLTQKDFGKCRPAIAPDAYAIIGNHYVLLSDAIEHRGTSKGLPDERGWELSTVHSIAGDGAQEATLVLRTVQKKSGAFHFHTVVCVRSGDGEWKIRHWHTGQ